MQAAVAFDATTRETSGKGAARALRRDGKVPANIYGPSKTNLSLALSTKEVTLEYLRGGFFNKIVEIKTGKSSVYALPKAVQLHPVTDVLEHVDFYQVDEKSSIRVMVPVHFLNMERSIGIKRGGVLNVVRHNLELICKVNNIPKFIEIDLLDINIGDSIHISHVKLPEGTSPAIKSRDFTIAAMAGRGGKDDADDTAGPVVAAGAVPADKAKAPEAAAAAGKGAAKPTAKPAAKK